MLVFLLHYTADHEVPVSCKHLHFDATLLHLFQTSFHSFWFHVVGILDLVNSKKGHLNMYCVL